MLPPLSCQCPWDFRSRDLIPVYVRRLQPLWKSWSIVYLQPLWRSWSFVYLHHGDSDLCILYMAMTTYVICCIMPIHGHCTLMYLGLLYVFAVICRVVSLYYAYWLAGLPFGILYHSTSGMNVLCISAIVWPLWPHTLGGICYSLFYHTRWITLDSPVPLQTP